MKRVIFVVLITALTGCFHSNKKEYYKNGVLKSECSYLSGIEDGQCIDYDSMGNIRQIGYFKMGKEEGVFKYYKNGIISSICQFKNGKYYGYVYDFFDNGRFESKYYYINDEKLKTFDYDSTTGYIKSEYETKNEKLNGVFKSYKNGVLYTSELFRNDSLIEGESKVYKADGSIDTLYH